MLTLWLHIVFRHLLCAIGEQGLPFWTHGQFLLRVQLEVGAQRQHRSVRALLVLALLSLLLFF